MDHSKQTIVISGINLTQGGPLSIFQDCLKELNEHVTSQFNIYALVHNRKLFPDDSKINFIEFPKSTQNYLFRLYYEFFYFKKISYKINPVLWVSLHDISPNVKSTLRAVYCHNPSLFYSMSLREILLDPKFALFCWLYQWLYKINISHNDFVIVQQEWIRREFEKRYVIAKSIVAYPSVSIDSKKSSQTNYAKTLFIYPSMARVFKNIELIGEALRCITEPYKNKIEVLVTVDGSENRYAKWLVKKYCDIEGLKFIGFQHRDKVFELYHQSDCLIFPSKLETWGLPISEFKSFEKPMLLADLEYAHETVGDYKKVCFFDPKDACQLARLMEKCVDNRLEYDASESFLEHNGLVSHSWKELFDILLKSPPKMIKEILC